MQDASGSSLQRRYCCLKQQVDGTAEVKPSKMFCSLPLISWGAFRRDTCNCSRNGSTEAGKKSRDLFCAGRVMDCQLQALPPLD